MYEEPGELALLALGGGAATIFYGCGVVISFSLWYFDSGAHTIL
jgi:hypothetical protein